MTGNEFLRRIKRLGRDRDIAVRFDPSPGKAVTARFTMAAAAQR
jgi:hypothetical protein